MPGQKIDNADAIQSKVAPRMSSKMLGLPPKWLTNKDGFKDNNRYIEEIFSLSTASYPMLCNTLVKYRAVKGAGFKAGDNSDDESSGACGCSDKGSVKEV